MTEVFVKLLGKGLESREHDKFEFEIEPESTIRDLIVDLHEEFGEQFEIYLGDIEKRVLKRDTVVILNGSNMVAHKGEQSTLSDGDMIVFMIAAVGG
ncbi:MAG: MoaD/ThiS family protein [Candidatus Thorarchaeota archaeon]|jgi:molybdopterin converting factor small subunit